MILAAQPAAEPHAPGLGEFMTATQLRHAKQWFAGQAKNWDLAGYEIDEIKEGLEDAAKQFPAHDGLQVADMIKSHTHTGRARKGRRCKEQRQIQGGFQGGATLATPKQKKHSSKSSARLRHR